MHSDYQTYSMHVLINFINKIVLCGQIGPIILVSFKLKYQNVSSRNPSLTSSTSKPLDLYDKNVTDKFSRSLYLAI